MAMSSRSSSAVSLPFLTAERLDLAKNAPRRRQVRLKTIMRKESRPERDKGHGPTDAQSMTETERKRYEGVWASNYCQDADGRKKTAFLTIWSFGNCACAAICLMNCLAISGIFCKKIRCLRSQGI
jgi:hypothetical protein